LSRTWTQTAALSVLGLCLVWAFWPTLRMMADRWSHDPQYSHGFLVPVFAAVVLWHRRERVPRTLTCSWWGLVLLVLGVSLHLAGGYRDVEPLDAFSLLPTLAGLCLLLGGWPLLKWTWPAIAFLGFMLPLPFHVETALAHPLRRLATAASTYCLQTLGFPTVAHGNIIYIDDVKLGVAEACNGLGMLMTFFALSTAVAVLIPRRPLDKWLIVASAVPIALVANIARVTATGAAHCTWGAGAGQFLHDWAGWLMMPLALGLLWLELKYLDRLVVPGDPPAPLPIDFAAQSQALPRSRDHAGPMPAETRTPSPAVSPLPTPTAATPSVH